MTATEASKIIASRLNDPVSAGTDNGNRYKADLRLAGLDAATRLVVTLLSKINPAQLEEFRKEIIKNVQASGIDMNSEINDYFAFLSVDVNIDSEWIPADPVTHNEILMGNNYWVKGSSFAPKYVVKGDTLHVKISVEDYPVSCKINYAREPKRVKYTVVNSSTETSTIELHNGLIEAMFAFAMWHCALQGNDNFAQEYYQTAVQLLSFGRIQEDNK